MKKIALRSLLGCGVVGASLLATAPARAEQGTGFELGFRTGFGTPLGKAAGDALVDLNEGVAGQIPLWLDLGYRVTPKLQVGAYFSYGFGINGGKCYGECSSSDLRLGVGVQYHFQTVDQVSPWIGAGAGYEWLNLTQSFAGGKLDATIQGFELLNAAFGVDFPVASKLALGPFLSVTLGQFSSRSGGSVSEDIAKKSFHEWIFLGVRGTFSP